MPRTRHDKLFDIPHQWGLFLQRCDVKEADLPDDQRREMRRAFYGAWGQFLFLMRDDFEGMPDPECAVVLSRFQKQVGDFWDQELKEQQAAQGKFEPTDKARWEQDVLKDELFTGTTPPVRLVKKPDDAICTRASCGGGDKFMYVTYRGPLAEVEKVLKTCLKAVTHALIRQNRDQQ